MSFNVRDSVGLAGPLGGVEIPNGAAASTVVAHQLVEVVGVFAQNATSFPANFVATVLITPPNPSVTTGATPLGATYKVMGVSIFYSAAAGGAATLLIENVPAGTANGAGAAVLAAPFALNTGQSNTPFSPALSTNVNNLTLLPNSRLNIYAGATATTTLAGMTCVVYVARIS